MVQFDDFCRETVVSFARKSTGRLGGVSTVGRLAIRAGAGVPDSTSRPDTENLEIPVRDSRNPKAIKARLDGLA